MGRRILHPRDGVSRRLMIRSGSSPVECAASRPKTLQEAKPKAGSLFRGNGPWRRTADGSQAQKSSATPATKSQADRLFDLTFPSAAGHPDENQSGRTRGEKDTWARSGRNAEPPAGGIKPAKGQNPRSAAGREMQEGGFSIARQGRGSSIGVAEHHAKGRDGA